MHSSAAAPRLGAGWQGAICLLSSQLCASGPQSALCGEEERAVDGLQTGPGLAGGQEGITCIRAAARQVDKNNGRQPIYANQRNQGVKFSPVSRWGRSGQRHLKHSHRPLQTTRRQCASRLRKQAAPLAPSRLVPPGCCRCCQPCRQLAAHHRQGPNTSVRASRCAAEIEKEGGGPCFVGGKCSVWTAWRPHDMHLPCWDCAFKASSRWRLKGGNRR